MFFLPPARHQERAELAAGRRHLEARQALYAQLQRQLDTCPESVREQVQEQLRRVSVTSPLPGPERPCPEERRARDRTTWALPYLPGCQGRCFVWRGQGGLGISLLLPAVPGGDACDRGLAKPRNGGWMVAEPFPFPRVQPPNSEGYFRHHPTPCVTVVQGGRGPGGRDQAL